MLELAAGSHQDCRQDAGVTFFLNFQTVSYKSNFIFLYVFYVSRSRRLRICFLTENIDGILRAQSNPS